MESSPCFKRRFILSALVVWVLFAAIAIRVSMPPVEEEEPIPEPMVYPCEPALGVQVDGDLSEWDGALWAPLGVESQAKGRWGGRRDAEARIALRWDEDALHLAARVRDDRIVSARHPRLAEGDCVELTLGDAVLRVSPSWPDRAEILGVPSMDGEAERRLARPLGPAEELSFAFDAAGRPYMAELDISGRSGLGGLSDGWGRPELREDGMVARPVLGRRARLSIPVFGKFPLELTFVGQPSRAAPGQRMTVWVNGQRVGVFPSDGWSSRREFSALVAQEALNLGMNDIVLDFEHSCEDEEGRPVSAWFESIAMRPLGDPGAQPSPLGLLFAGDANGEGREEVCGLADGRLFAFNPRTGWGWASRDRFPDARCAAVGDLTGDGDKDIALLDRNGDFIHLFVPATGASHAIPIKDAPVFPGSFRPAPDSEAWRDMVLADVNLDGETELVGLSRHGVVVLSLRGEEWAGMQRLSAPPGARWLFWGDFKGDGTRQLVAMTEPSQGIVLARVFTPSRDGLEAGETYHPIWFEAERAFAADLTGDGAEEIVLAARRGASDWRLSAWSPATGESRFLGGAAGVEELLCAHFQRGLPPPMGARDEGGQAATPTRKGKEICAEAEENALFDLDLLPGTRTAAVRTEAGFDIEAVIPWKSVGVDPKAGSELAFSLAYVDDDGGREPARLVYDGGERHLRMLLLEDRLSGSEHERFMDALTACSAPPGPFILGDEPVVEVIKGVAAGRGPSVDSVTMRSPKGKESRGRRLDSIESLGCEVERWRISPERLDDGAATVLVSYGGEIGPVAELKTDIRVETYRKALAEGKRTVEALRGLVERFPQAAPTLLVRAMTQLADVEQMQASGNRRGLGDAPGDFRELRRLAESMEGGGGEKLRKALEEPLRAYWCEIDGSPQPYHLQVPPGYQGKRDWPLVVSLHGAGYSPSRRVSAPGWPEAFVVAPHGRGWTDYMYLGEQDVLRVIELLQSQYRIDPDRIYIVGSSMGGTGCLHLAARHPHLFAAIAPVCANSDAALWAEKWGPFFPPDDPARDLREHMLARLSPATYAANLLNVHVIAAHGARDLVVYPEATRRVIERLRLAGGAPIYREEPRAGHSVPARARDGMSEWLLSQQRARRPRRVVLRAAEPEHRRAHWVEVNRMTTPLEIAEVEAYVAAPNEIRVRQSNVESLTLHLAEWLHREAPERETLLFAGQWGAEGAGAAVHGLTATIRADGVSESPSAWFRITPPTGEEARWVSVNLWLQGGEADPGPVSFSIRPYSPDGDYAGRSPRGARPLAARTVKPGEEWQSVTLHARVPEGFSRPLACVVELGDGPSKGEVRVREATAWFGDGPYEAWRRPDDAPHEWLTSEVREAGGFFPWVPADQAHTAKRISRKPPGQGAPTVVPEDGLSLGEFALRGEAGETHTAGVWARSEEGGLLRLVVVDSRTGETLAEEMRIGAPSWRILSAPFERPAYTHTVELRIESGKATAEAVGLFLLRAPVPPDAYRFPREPGLIDRALPLTVRVNDRVAYQGPVPEGGVIRIGDEPEPPDGLAKTDRLRGPIGHAFEAPFMIVYGTQGGERERRMARREAEVFADDWRLRHQVDCRMKADTEVTEEDIARYHLVLYGGPGVNAVADRLATELPLRVEGDAIVAGDARYEGGDLGMKVIYPNPLNPSRYVVVLASTTWRGMFQMTKRFGNWFGWRIYENWSWYDFVVFDDVSRGPASFLAFGFFDEGWGMAPERAFPGDGDWRRAIPPRGTPSLDTLDPARKTTWLSEMLPESGGMRMGAAGFDRSFRGNPLRPGGKPCERGLGVRVGAEHTWRLDGLGDRFRAVVGVDNEGEEPTEERKRWTRVRFEVWGDGERLGASSVHRWNDPPEELDVDVSGVDLLTLNTVARGGRSWVYGSASWGEARVARRGVGEPDAGLGE